MTSRLILLETLVLTVEKRIYKYRMGEDRKKHCGDGLG